MSNNGEAAKVGEPEGVTVRISIDGQDILAEKGSTILRAAKNAGIYLPALCFHPLLPPMGITLEDSINQGSRVILNDGTIDNLEPCGLCVVQVAGQDEPVRACNVQVENGMVVFTDTQDLQEIRREKLRKILNNHPNICLTCDRVPRCPPFGVCVRSANVANRCVACPGYDRCELLQVVDYVGMIGAAIPNNAEDSKPVDDNPFFEFDPALCIGCLRCVRLCKDVRGIDALGIVINKDQVHVGTKSRTFLESGCHFCMGCVEVCPIGALTDKREKWKTLDEEDRQREIVPCIKACPLEIDIPQYIYNISQKKNLEALNVIQDKLPFPLLCGTVCTSPCEDACRRGEMDEPVAIRDLKRFAAEQSGSAEEMQSVRKTGKTVAVVGSGPAGLTAAYLLSVKGGHSVTIFEAMSEPGGMPLACIPHFRLPKKVLNIEIERVIRSGVEVITDSPVESIDKLLKEGFDAILLATGAHGETSLGIAGEDHPSVVGALNVLRRVNAGEKLDLGEKVVVIGGGNVAVDAARVSLRLGSKDVKILYRRSDEEMPADAGEVAQAKKEGVEVMFLVAPTRISFEGNNKLALHLVKTKLTRRDISGRRRPKPVKGTDFSMEVNTVIKATGQHPEIPPDFGLDTGKENTLKVDKKTLMTNREGVFAAGDVVTGPWTITQAIAMGDHAARSIHRYLGGEGLAETYEGKWLIPNLLNQNNHFLKGRVPMKSLPVEKCRLGFDQVALGYTEDMAENEANRCFRCSLRLDIIN